MKIDTQTGEFVVVGFGWNWMTGQGADPEAMVAERGEEPAMVHPDGFTDGPCQSRRVFVPILSRAPEHPPWIRECAAFYRQLPPSAIGSQGMAHRSAWPDYAPEEFLCPAAT